ncbi:LysR family transcriptional regulator [Pseudonocardia sp. TRM90224]|uniref:LysR family transcriptional regulator n=1 Tax=Pseudonocardia sp. TRM90224 TaxID=2812678 RepID=UPI001E58E350|nr:LysR family transcriptional regulator [Pseudonocardia sp. TRM90224]
MLDLWSLRVLVAVADSGSFSGATEQLALTQPAVSRQVAGLERHVGVPLFVRLHRGVRPTDAGEAAIDRARAVLTMVAELEAHMRAHAGLTAGMVRISAFPSAAMSVVPAVFSRFAAEHPDVELALVDVPSTEGTHAVRTGDVDIAVVTELDGPADGVELVPLVEDELLIALPAHHPNADDPALSLPALAADTWIEGAHPDCLGRIDELRLAIGAAPVVGFTCEDWNAKQAFVAAGLGVTIVPASARAAVRSDVVLRRPTPALEPRRVFLAALPQRHRGPAVGRMVELFHEVVAAMQPAHR